MHSLVDFKNMQIILSKMKACVIISKSSQKPSNSAKWQHSVNVKQLWIAV